MDRTKLKDTMGRPLTQGLFLEINYDTKYAVYTLDEEDKTYNGVVYPSLKALFLKIADPTEYKFAKQCLLNWRHWVRLNANKVLREYFDEWREELEVMLRSDAIDGIAELATDGNFQAAKFLAEKGWDQRPAGRPSKAEKEREMRITDRISDALTEDINRMEGVKLDG